MKVERQGRSECMLATLAALAGVSLSYVKDMALAYAATSDWMTVYLEPDRFWKTVPYVASKLGLERVVAEAREAVHNSVISGHDANKNFTIPLHGKGAVVVMSDCSAHIMPWEDGLVYDPESSNPGIGRTLSDYLLDHLAMRVISISTL